MLLTSFLLLTSGFTLMYAGVHSGEAWKHPWSPIVDQLGKVSSSRNRGPATSTPSPAPTTGSGTVVV